jgi:single-strand DNA-binding protein
MNLNKVFILGRLTADPQVKATASGQSICNLGVATNRVWFDKDKQKQEEVEFHNVVLWGRQAEIAGQYLTRGALALIEGRLQTRSWTDKDGNQHRITEIVCESLQLGPAPSKDAARSLPRATGKPELAAEEKLPSLDEEEIKPEDIPF